MSTGVASTAEQQFEDMKSRHRSLHAPHRPLAGWRVFSLATLAPMRGPPVILTAALADHNQLRLEGNWRVGMAATRLAAH